MPKDIQSKAIQPFFTTRANTGGTGLGLSIVYGFINQSGGKLDIISTEGKGTTVKITLPLVEAEKTFNHPDQDRRALLVDDSAKDREVAAKALTELGYTTTVCISAKDAIRALETEEFTLVVSDFDLGEAQSGIDVLARAQELLPEAERILVSGKSTLNGTSNNTYKFIEKPLTDAGILRVMQAS